MGCINEKSEKHLKPGIVLRNSILLTSKRDCKIVLLGDVAVGKSSIAERFCKNKLSKEYGPTLGAAFLSVSIGLKNGESMKINL
jgi:GTPase SAR1 family protein